jgi:hypothetical protein
MFGHETPSGNISVAITLVKRKRTAFPGKSICKPKYAAISEESPETKPEITPTPPVDSILLGRFPRLFRGEIKDAVPKICAKYLRMGLMFEYTERAL